MAKTQAPLQERFLAELKDGKLPVAFFLLSGIKLQGYIEAFDEHVIVLGSHNNHQMIYKHAVSTIVPSSAVPIKENQSK